jgi:hypothetical protein
MLPMSSLVAARFEPGQNGQLIESAIYNCQAERRTSNEQRNHFMHPTSTWTLTRIVAPQSDLTKEKLLPQRRDGQAVDVVVRVPQDFISFLGLQS